MSQEVAAVELGLCLDDRLRMEFTQTGISTLTAEL